MDIIFKRIGCVIGIHEYRCVSTRHYYDTSCGDEAESTVATNVCRTCQKVDVKCLYAAGFLSVSDLANAQAEGRDK
jgi:hypothetical protein